MWRAMIISRIKRLIWITSSNKKRDKFRAKKRKKALIKNIAEVWEMSNNIREEHLQNKKKIMILIITYAHRTKIITSGKKYMATSIFMETSYIYSMPRTIHYKLLHIPNNCQWRELIMHFFKIKTDPTIQAVRDLIILRKEKERKKKLIDRQKVK